MFVSHFLCIWTWKCVWHLSQQRVWQSPHNFQNTFRQLLTLTLVSKRNSVRLYFGSLETSEYMQIYLSQKSHHSCFGRIDPSMSTSTLFLLHWTILEPSCVRIFSHLLHLEGPTLQIMKIWGPILCLLWKCRSRNPELPTLIQCRFISNKLK